MLVTSEEDRRHRLLTRRITSFRRVGDLYRRDQEVHRQRLLDRGRSWRPSSGSLAFECASFAAMARCGLGGGTSACRSQAVSAC